MVDSGHGYFYCDMTGIPASERGRHMEVTRKVFGIVNEIQELPNGYSFLIPNEPGFRAAAEEFVEREKKCCPFFAFAILTVPNGISLQLTGDEGVKPFIQEEIGRALREDIAILHHFK